MKRTKLLKSAPCPTPNKRSENVIAVSQIVKVDDQEALNIDMFYGGELKARYFADASVFNTYVFLDKKWYTCRIDNVARLCKCKKPLCADIYLINTEWEWNTKADEKRALDYLDTYSMFAYEGEINSKKSINRYFRKLERIKNMMAEIPCVPDEAEKWVLNEVFTGHVLFFKRNDERDTYSCTACGAHSWKKKGWKHGEKTICPKCGQPVTANMRQERITKKHDVVILQNYNEKWVERQFKAICEWTPDGKNLHLFEEIRVTLDKGSTYGKVWYGQNREADEFAQEFYNTNSQNKRFTKSYLWPGNLQEVLPYGNLETSGLDILARDKVQVNVNRFILYFQNIRYIEYLIKNGLTRLSGEIIDVYAYWSAPPEICTHARSLKEALKLDGNRANRMKQVNGNLATLSWLQYEAEKNIKISQEALLWLTDKDLDVDEVKDVLEELKSVNRMVNYLKKQKIAPSKVATIWCDYLKMAKDEGLDTSDDIVRLPKDLKARHDALVEIINDRKHKKESSEYKKSHAGKDKMIQKRLPDAAIYFFENENYMIIPAGKCEELREEGYRLHHCVGASDTYIDKMIDGKSWICFLRKKENLEESYYTLEVDMKTDKILQAYSAFDRTPDKEIINKVLNEFKKNIKKARQKVEPVKANIA